MLRIVWNMTVWISKIVCLYAKFNRQRSWLSLLCEKLHTAYHLFSVIIGTLLWETVWLSYWKFDDGVLELHWYIISVENTTTFTKPAIISTVINLPTDVVIHQKRLHFVFLTSSTDIRTENALDLSAAFDTLDHSTLLRRIEVYFAITGEPRLWLLDYLNNRQPYVRVGSSTWNHYCRSMVYRRSRCSNRSCLPST